MEAGIRIIELSQKLHSMFVKQSAHEKRRLLDFVVSNCLWKDGLITPTFRQPFDMLAVAVARNLPSEVASEVPSARNENWLPFVGDYRTFLNCPSVDHAELFGESLAYGYASKALGFSCLPGI
jgi:hypothetical protein